jgi:hypothetical protein
VKDSPPTLESGDGNGIEEVRNTHADHASRKAKLFQATLQAPDKSNFLGISFKNPDGTADIDAGSKPVPDEIEMDTMRLIP